VTKNAIAIPLIKCCCRLHSTNPPLIYCQSLLCVSLTCFLVSSHRHSPHRTSPFRNFFWLTISREMDDPLTSVKCQSIKNYRAAGRGFGHGNGQGKMKKRNRTTSKIHTKAPTQNDNFILSLFFLSVPLIIINPHHSIINITHPSL
jgi:hypothetical protein